MGSRPGICSIDLVTPPDSPVNCSVGVLAWAQSQLCWENKRKMSCPLNLKEKLDDSQPMLSFAIENEREEHIQKRFLDLLGSS